MEFSFFAKFLFRENQPGPEGRPFGPGTACGGANQSGGLIGPGRLELRDQRFLGGAGRWRDSGMAGTPSADHPRAFVQSGREAVDEVVAVLDDFRPHLVVTYDPRGGYGHPDHIRAHEVVHAAIDAGITLFDVADTYGREPGLSETMLGKALGKRGSGSRRPAPRCRW